MAKYDNVAIVGVGLIGGSIGLALRERGLAGQLIGIGRRQSSLDQALACGAIDQGTTDLTAGVADADLVVVASPVEVIVDHVCQALAAAPETALVLDAGSTKDTICRGVAQRAGELAARFVGSHPLAGDHRSGPENARADLLQGKTVVITPTEVADASRADQAESFWEALGATVVRMSPAEHDRALASTSHLPHLVASALAAATPAEWLAFTSSGWADTTRVAAGDPQLWTQIFQHNADAVSTALAGYVEQLQQVQTSMTDADWATVADFLQQAKRTRDALGN